jgi:hypothetical protein
LIDAFVVDADTRASVSIEAGRSFRAMPSS